jgi:hypothetical protein
MINNDSEFHCDQEAVFNAAEQALAMSLKTLANRMELDSRDIIDCLRKGHISAWSSLYYELSKQIAEQLGILCKEVKKVYIDEYDIVPEDSSFGETSRTTVIYLIVWVQHKTNPLVNSLISALDQALVKKFNTQIGKPKLAHLLEAHLIDDVDANNPEGYGAWITSDHFFLSEIWSREEVELDLYDSLTKEKSIWQLT